MSETAFHAALPPLGFVEEMTSPSGSIATHSDTDGQEMRRGCSGNGANVHCGLADAGFVDVTTPPTANPTHKDSDGQEMSHRPLECP